MAPDDSWRSLELPDSVQCPPEPSCTHAIQQHSARWPGPIPAVPHHAVGGLCHEAQSAPIAAAGKLEPGGGSYWRAREMIGDWNNEGRAGGSRGNKRRAGEVIWGAKEMREELGE